MIFDTNVWNRLRYTVWAPSYDVVAAFPGQRRRSIDLLDLKPAESVLILGAGTGLDVPHLPDSVAITAIDLTPAMLDRARRRAAALRRAVELHVMDGQQLDFPSATFDAVILHLILAVIPNPVSCINEAARVLKPGGRATVFDKFVADDAAPSVARRLLNVATSVLFSDINRRLGPIIASSCLREEHREPAFLGGVFQISLLRKPGG